MKVKKSVRGVIFDVGGTLIYSNFEHFERANAWSAALALRRWGYELEGEAFARDLLELRRRSPKEGENCRQISTTKGALIEVAMKCGIRLDEEEVGRLERAFYTPEIAGSVALPGIVEVIDALQPHVKLAIISNTRSHHLIHGVVNKLGVREHFDPFITSAEFGFRKPSLKLFEAVLEAWQLPAETTVMVGDSLHKDIAPAKALGMRTVWQKLDSRVDTERPDAAAKQPKDILKILAHWRFERY